MMQLFDSRNTNFAFGDEHHICTFDDLFQIISTVCLSKAMEYLP